MNLLYLVFYNEIFMKLLRNKKCFKEKHNYQDSLVYLKFMQYTCVCKIHTLKYICNRKSNQAVNLFFPQFEKFYSYDIFANQHN